MDIKRCLICGCESSKEICCDCSVLTKDYEWLREYLNSLSTVTKDTLSIIKFSIVDRESCVVSKVRFDSHNRMISNGSKYVNRKIEEIRGLEKAAEVVKGMIC